MWPDRDREWQRAKAPSEKQGTEAGRTNPKQNMEVTLYAS